MLACHGATYIDTSQPPPLCPCRGHGEQQADPVQLQVCGQGGHAGRLRHHAHHQVTAEPLLGDALLCSGVRFTALGVIVRVTLLHSDFFPCVQPLWKCGGMLHGNDVGDGVPGNTCATDELLIACSSTLQCLPLQLHSR